MHICRHLLVVILVITVGLISSCGWKSHGTLDQKRADHGKRLYEKISNSNIPWKVIGSSVEGRNIYQLEMGRGDSTILFLGGFHGSEISGVELAYRFAELLHGKDSSEFNSRVILIPVLNPDGLIRATRRNANGVDVNRNFPTENWSTEHRSAHNYPGDAPGTEPETIIVMNLLGMYQPQRIVTIHAPLEMVNYDGPARDLAERMSEFNHYPVTSDIGYPTPGSFGTYAGRERQIPTITLELPRGAFTEKMWEDNSKALLSILD